MKETRSTKKRALLLSFAALLIIVLFNPLLGNIRVSNAAAGAVMNGEGTECAVDSEGAAAQIDTGKTTAFDMHAISGDDGTELAAADDGGMSDLALSGSSITQFGITWTFDGEYEYGQFANGDYWVLGPVTIIDISPPSSDAGGRIINGSMVNPDPKAWPQQGYDSIMSFSTYDAGLNVARPNGMDLGVSNPLVLQPGSSLISTISITNPEIGHRPFLETAAILTVLGSQPPEGSFRPPYCGGDKTIPHNVSQIDYGKLPSLPRLSESSSFPWYVVPQTYDTYISIVEDYFERPWIDYLPSLVNRCCHPRLNMPDYGGTMTVELSEASLLLMTEYPREQIETLMVRYLQVGIDFAGVVINDGDGLGSAGGLYHGRKWPILFAGIMLDDPMMKDIADASKYHIFQEDQQTFYITRDDVGRPLYHNDNYTRVEYIQMDVGNPDWGEQRPSQPVRDGRNMDSEYRQIVANSMDGCILSAYVMHAQGLWNWPALFQHQDRWWEYNHDIDGSGNDVYKDSYYTNIYLRSMWNAYRSSYGPPYKAPGTMVEGQAPTVIYQGTPQEQTVLANVVDTVFQATASSSSRINLNWPDNNDNETGFKIERRTENSDFVEIARVGANVTSFSDGSGLAPGTKYYYHVIACNDEGESYPAVACTTTLDSSLAAPSGLNATASSFSRIDLSWSDNSDDEDGFKVERSQNGVDFTEIAMVGAGVTSYGDTGLTASITYHYRVYAYNAIGDSGYSNTAQATTLAGDNPPDNPPDEPAPSTTFYFAEGYTGSGFEEWLCLMNPGEAAANAHITYMFSDGATQSQDVPIGATTRETVNVNSIVGQGKNVSVMIDADSPIVAERPMYFNYKGIWTGGHDVVGATSPSDTFYFAEGYTGSGFEEWLCLQNPVASPTTAHITYMFSDGATQSQDVPIGATTRETVNVNLVVGSGKNVSVKITSGSPIVAERPMYFNYRGKWDGGHDVVGAVSPKDTFYFAEGYTGTGFEEWLCLQNPGASPTTAHITYMFSDGATQSQEVPIGATTRETVNVNAVVGPGKNVSVMIDADSPIVAERPMYFNYRGIWTGGHDVVGYSP